MFPIKIPKANYIEVSKVKDEKANILKVSKDKLTTYIKLISDLSTEISSSEGVN